MIVAALALPFTLLFQECGISAATGRANDLAIGPAKPNHVVKRVVRVSTKDYSLLQSLGLTALFAMFFIGFHETRIRQIC
jgi:hypothetical protein